MIRGVDSTGRARLVVGSCERTASGDGERHGRISRIEPAVERVIEP